MEDRIDFSITGEEFDRVQRFREGHKKCIEKHPNLTGAQFEYCFSEDGMGLFKTVTCVCGESIALTADYDMTVANKPFQIVPTNEETIDLVKLTLSLRKRPGMLTGKAQERSYKVLHAYLAGRSCNNNLYRDIFWRANRRLERESEGSKFSDEEMYDRFFAAFEDTLREEYPAFTSENGFFENNEKNKDLEKMENRMTDKSEKLEKITVFFENCEKVSFSEEDIFLVNFEGITEQIYFDLSRKVRRKKTVNDVELRFTKSGADRLIDTFTSTPVRAYERITQYQDICMFRLIFQDGTDEDIYPYWKGTDTHNDSQFSVANSNGSLDVYIYKSVKKRKKKIKEHDDQA